MQIHKHEGGKKYVTILADGKFHQAVPEGTEGEVKREIKDKQTGLVTDTKNEIVFDSVSGEISKISFEDGEFGKNLLIEIDGDGVMSLSTASNFGEDVMKKIPSIDFSKDIIIAPYAFDAEGKTRKGVTLTQDGVKLESAYYDKETKKAKGGIPEPEGDTSKFDSDDWKIHFMKVRKFLVGQVEEIISQNGFGM